MRRPLTASLLFSLVLFATAAGQQPKPKLAPKAEEDKKAGTKPADSIDAAITAALANDPDVRMAKAKIQLAEAELAKARQAITLKVVALKAKINQLKADVRAAEDRLAWANAMFQKAALQQSEVLAARDKLDAARGALALAESEWKLLTGGGMQSGAAGATDMSVAAGLKWLGEHSSTTPERSAALMAYLMAIETARGKVATGPIPDRLRAVLDKPVKLGAKGEKITFEKALEVFKKDAGFDVAVRGELPLLLDIKTGEFTRPIVIVSQGEELPVGAWLQLFEDMATVPNLGNGQPIRHRFYIREYGLFTTDTSFAPPDAPTLTDFWKQKPPAKEPMPKR